MQPLTPASNTEARQQDDDDTDASPMNDAIWNSPVKFYFWQRRAGFTPRQSANGTLLHFCDGDTDEKERRISRRLPIKTKTEKFIAALEANPTVTAEYMQRTRDEQRAEMESEQENDNE